MTVPRRLPLTPANVAILLDALELAVVRESVRMGDPRTLADACDRFDRIKALQRRLTSPPRQAGR